MNIPNRPLPRPFASYLARFSRMVICQSAYPGCIQHGERRIMQSQRQEERQEHDPTSSLQVAEASPVRSRENVYDYAYYKEIFSGHAMPFVTSTLTCSIRTYAR